MLVFPNCKINLGLNITKKRPDGFHDIETVFYPINWCDALEVIENKEGTEPFLLSESGLKINGKKEDNLIFKAWLLFNKIKAIPPIKVHLHKNLPMGAGLGGGSSDAAFFINLIDQKFEFNLTNSQKITIASKLGSDCSFFINNQPVLAKGKGDQFSPIKINLSNYYILVVNPNINCNTKEAYNSITPKLPQIELVNIIENVAISEWKTVLFNDFEETMFIKYPEIKVLKDSLYNLGALYACMSGSGSSVFGIFETEPELKFNTSYKYYLQTPASKTL
ncbi:MAG: 4-(cytidine 5'-diphospho)-2-C-methyl-D-erythritol kinase [Bacteroidota bacterium]|nr:4-(cytidine 5'-diphospho)-2-C-methyl-D-erythritol kinase [Bacteroidota bacterium]MDP3143893.1 4-(cytidine 5'-diphospho)-2-C-methyl-D-erythritol kinase [Bacteroidota bacterium]MDP3558041.1 4-(cytidine 5'-diphospho)-2-C-methyl-D-erythritol kinase [Bacteroidota bacterium]